MNKDKKLVFGVLALLVGIIVISISYAAFTQNLNINGTGNVQATSWSVHFANLTNAVTSGTAHEDVAPTIKASRTDIGDYEVSFYTPGDSITYKFDVVNDGDYDAKIAVVTKGTPSCSGTDATSNTNVCNNLEYTLKYTSNNQDVAVNDTLRKNETKNMTLVLRYKNTIGQNELPTSEVTVSNLGITLQYAQDSLAGGNPVTSTYLYSVNTSGQNIGDTLVANNTNVFDNYSAAVTAYEHPYFTAHVTNSSDVITESYVGFVLNGNDYYLQGTGATYNSEKDYYNADSIYYASNKAVLNEAFGSSNCQLYDDGTYYECHDSVSGLYVGVYARGEVGVDDGDAHCIVYGDGYSSCYAEVPDPSPGGGGGLN